jgi:transposase InsO family protein
MEMGWLLRYPCPVRVIHDNGPEFQEPFRQLLLRYGIENVATSVRNPQANAICERMHQVVGNILRTLVHVHPPPNMPSAAAAVDYALATASHALRTTVHKTLGLSPGAVVFHRDMLIDVPFVADLLLLRDKRQAVIDYNLRRENNARRSFDYQVRQSY